MFNQAVINNSQKIAIDSAIKNKKENLKQRAYLNSLSGMIDFAGAQITGFIINPFIVRGLGSSMYGIWQVIMQMTSYANMADSRAMQALKWSIANKRDVVDNKELRSDVTTALVVTLVSMPISLIIGSILSWYAPIITHADERYFSLIRVTVSLLILSLVINKVFDLFEAVLGGMNLGYKRMGLRAGLVIFAGVLKVLVITRGYGLVGLAVVQVLISFITGLTFYFIIRKNIGWFGFGKTSILKVKAFGKASSWYMAFSAVKMILLSSDKIILGYIVGPLYVSKYALTMFTSFAIQGGVVALITGIIPGMGTLFGKGEFEKVKKARRIIGLLAWLFSVSGGVSVLLLNKSFIELWLGKDHYAGGLENLLILLISIQVIFFQIDSLLINVTLNQKMKVLLSASASALTILLAFLLVGKLYILGLCISVLIGRLILTIGLPLIIKNKMKDESALFSISSFRPILISVILFVFASYVSQWISIASWLYLLIAGVLSLVCTGFLFWHVGIKAIEREHTLEVLSAVKLFRIKNS